jgi:hypothetical protein
MVSFQKVAQHKQRQFWAGNALNARVALQALDDGLGRVAAAQSSGEGDV